MTQDEIERIVHPDFQEIGASGESHDRTSCIETILERTKVATSSQNDWIATSSHCMSICENSYLLTYHLIQNSEKRVTERSSIWVVKNGNWSILYHQGTVVCN